MKKVLLNLAKKRINAANKALKELSYDLARGSTVFVTGSSALFIASADLEVWRLIFALAEKEKNVEDVIVTLTDGLIAKVASYRQSVEESSSQLERAVHCSTAKAIQLLKSM